MRVSSILKSPVKQGDARVEAAAGPPIPDATAQLGAPRWRPQSVAPSACEYGSARGDALPPGQSRETWGAKERLDLPAAPVAVCGLFRVAVCQDEQVLHLPLTAHIARSDQMQAFVAKDPALLVQRADSAL